MFISAISAAVLAGMAAVAEAAAAAAAGDLLAPAKSRLHEQLLQLMQVTSFCLGLLADMQKSCMMVGQWQWLMLLKGRDESHMLHRRGGNSPPWPAACLM